MPENEGKKKSSSFVSSRSSKFLEKTKAYEGDTLNAALYAALCDTSTVFQNRIKQEEFVDSLSFDLHFIQTASHLFNANTFATSARAFPDFNAFVQETLTTFNYGLETYSEFAEKDYKKTVSEASAAANKAKGTIQDLALAISEGNADAISKSLKEHAAQSAKLEKSQLELAKPDALKKTAENLVKETQDALKKSISNLRIQRLQDELNTLLATPPSV
ncbi:MAG: hypothetical protein KKE46_02925 [Gammaproteobacteria bacterium]|nr:hypothetical protein [Gammaproteobacteria bacterium]